MQEEIWKDIAGFEGLYQVSNLGRVKSLARYVNHPVKGFKRFKKDKMLKGSFVSGYLRVELYLGDKTKGMFIHRLVLLAFTPNPENKPQVNHINGIKTDNRLVNLEWVTEKENTNHSIDIGLRNAKGINNYQSKLTESDVLYIRSSTESLTKLASKFNVSGHCIFLCKKGRTYKDIAEQEQILTELESRI